MTKKWFVLVLVLLALAVPAFAILGLGDIVFDPTNYAEAIQQFLQLQQQLEQLVLTYNVVNNQYQQMLRMAQNLSAPTMLHYLSPGSPWVPSTAANTYGNTAGWIGGMNTGVGITSAYGAATKPLGTYGSAFGALSADQANSAKTAYATVELEDGANLAAIQTIGQQRNNAASVEMAIRALESDSLSTDPDLNTEVAVLNKVNAASVIQLRASQDTNQLLVTLAESQVIASKRQRDAEARAFNQHIAFVQQGQTELAAQSAGASDAMLSWRMP